MEDKPHPTIGEPTVSFCTLREAEDEWHLECRMSDGQKGAFVMVDGEFPGLAAKLRDFLNTAASLPLVTRAFGHRITVDAGVPPGEAWLYDANGTRHVFRL